MRLTKDLLLRFTKTFLAEKLQQKPKPVCVYATGSICTDQFLLGNTTDVDLVFIYNLKPEKAREILPLVPDSHLDIWNYEITRFEQPRRLRTDAWIGSFLCEDPIVLYDNAHWFQYTQASVAAQFFGAENSLNRAQPFLDAARKRWLDCYSGTNRNALQITRSVLHSLEDAANAYACLTAVPFGERRLVSQFNKLALASGNAALTEKFGAVIAPADWDSLNWPQLTQNWQSALKAVSVQPEFPVQLNAIRHAYYTSAANEYWEKLPVAALWIMLKTWSAAIAALPDQNECTTSWNSFSETIHFDAEHLEYRLELLDAFLDAVEAALDQFKHKYSLQTE